MKNKKIHCPACGSGDLLRSEGTETEKITISFIYDTVSYVCNLCKSDGDFSRVTDLNSLKAFKKVLRKMLKELELSIKRYQDEIKFSDEAWDHEGGALACVERIRKR